MEALLPSVPFMNCPIKTSLGVLGRKWTLLILRDFSFLGHHRFNQFMESIPGLTPRVLTMRLRELEAEGIIQRKPHPGHPLRVEWQLTEMGRDVMPILQAFVGFGAKWYPRQVFADGKPRSFEELFPGLKAKVEESTAPRIRRG